MAELGLFLFWSLCPIVQKSFSNKPKDFRPQEKGITFYYFRRSPCARRVWMVLLRNGVQFKGVEVNLLKGEQRTSSFLQLNPQGKVPILVVKNVPNTPDCVLYESSAIVLFVEEQFGGGLVPSNPVHRTEMRMWMNWFLESSRDRPTPLSLLGSL